MLPGDPRALLAPVLLPRPHRLATDPGTVCASRRGCLGNCCSWSQLRFPGGRLGGNHGLGELRPPGLQHGTCTVCFSSDPSSLAPWGVSGVSHSQAGGWHRAALPPPVPCLPRYRLWFLAAWVGFSPGCPRAGTRLSMPPAGGSRGAAVGLVPRGGRESEGKLRHAAGCHTSASGLLAVPQRCPHPGSPVVAASLLIPTCHSPTEVTPHPHRPAVPGVRQEWVALGSGAATAPVGTGPGLWERCLPLPRCWWFPCTLGRI